jgi:hypothetical protein
MGELGCIEMSVTRQPTPRNTKEKREDLNYMAAEA